MIACWNARAGGDTFANRAGGKPGHKVNKLPLLMRMADNGLNNSFGLGLHVHIVLHLHMLLVPNAAQSPHVVLALLG